MSLHFFATFFLLHFPLSFFLWHFAARDSPLFLGLSWHVAALAALNHELPLLGAGVDMA